MSLRKQLLILLSSLFLIAACGEKASENFSIETFTFNGSNVDITDADYRHANERIYLATSFLDKQMHLKLQVLVPDVQIGICLDELCIPFSLYDHKNEQDEAKIEGAAFQEGEQFYIPVDDLMESLGSTSTWDESAKELAIVYK